MPMTWLAVYAQHGSCSYGELSAERLREILLGDAPAPDERASVRQALLEAASSSIFLSSPPVFQFIINALRAYRVGFARVDAHQTKS